MEKKSLSNKKKPWESFSSTLSKVSDKLDKLVSRPSPREKQKPPTLEEALKHAKRCYPHQTQRLNEVRWFLLELSLPKEQLSAFPETPFIADFVQAGERIGFDMTGAFGDAVWWNDKVLSRLRDACGTDAARDFLRVCKQSLKDELEEMQERTDAVDRPQAKPLASSQAHDQSLVVSLTNSAVLAAERACDRVLLLSNLNNGQLHEHQRGQVLHDPALDACVQGLVDHVDAHPNDLGEVIKALCPSRGALQKHVIVLSLLMVKCMAQAAKAQQPFDVVAFVETLAATGKFPSTGMRTLVFAFDVMEPWSSDFKGQLVDELWRRSGESHMPPLEKALWVSMVEEFIHRGKFIVWSPDQWDRLNSANAQLKRPAVKVRLSVSRPGSVPAERPLESPSAPLSSGAPDSGSGLSQDLLRSGQEALTNALRAIVFDTTKLLYAGTYVKTVSDLAVQKVFATIWAQREEGPFPLTELVALVQDMDVRDRALVLLALLHVGLTSDRAAVDLKAFVRAALMDARLRGKQMIGLAAVLLNAHPGMDGTAQLLNGLLELADAPDLGMDDLGVLYELFKEVGYQSNKERQLAQADATRLYQAMDGLKARIGLLQRERERISTLV